jgi:alkaline phosphatase isozyme conversion protein
MNRILSLRNHGQITRRRMLLFIVSVLSIAMVGCTSPEDVEPVTVIGNEGLVLARAIATRYPFRKAGSPEETAVADMIVAELKKIGYTPEIQEIVGEEWKSGNIILRIEGTGFDVTSSDAVSGEAVKIRRSVVIGAHYDTPFGTGDAATYPDYNGIHDNASGVGALLSVAKELKTGRIGYDVVLVFFGAGNVDFLGARTYAGSMTADEIASTDAMYCIDSIFAGDKLYAHSGLNSLQPGMKYLRRRKLYEMSDVAIQNGIDLRFNESDLDVDVDGDGSSDVYREITTTLSDYSVFDAMNIPCVFLESYEYFASTVTEQTESRNPYFGETKGQIRGTNYDHTTYLEEVLEEGRLEKRIKNVAFLIVKAVEKGIYR